MASENKPKESVLDRVVLQYETGTNSPIIIKPDTEEMRRRYYVGEWRKMIPVIMMSQLRRNFDAKYRTNRPKRNS